MARLDGEDLPNTLRYPPFVATKRYSITQTAGGAVYQQAWSNGIIQGDGVIDWTMELLCFAELCQIYNIYKRPGPLLFEGQYGEELMVDFVDLRTTAQGGGNYSLNGQFLVRCILADICEGE